AGGEHGWDADQKGILRGERTAQAKNQGQDDGCAGARSAGKNGGDQLADAHRDDDGPGDVDEFVAFGFAAFAFFRKEGFDDEEGNAAEKERDGDGLKVLREFESLFLDDEAARAGDGKGDHDFEKVLTDGGIAPVEDELVEALVKKGNHGQNRAGLDDDVE